jgi:hypothetical protein
VRTACLSMREDGQAEATCAAAVSATGDAAEAGLVMEKEEKREERGESSSESESESS